MKITYIFITILYLFSSFISATEYRIYTTSGITDGYKKNNVINWDDIPYAKLLLEIQDGSHQENSTSQQKII